ncbi:hypothetical protein [Bacillus phage vB_BceS-M2]
MISPRCSVIEYKYMFYRLSGGVLKEYHLLKGL